MTKKIKPCLSLKRDNILKNLIALLMLFMLSACSDNSIVSIYDKDILNQKFDCIQLIVFPPNETIESTLKKSYKFQEPCELKFEVFTKGKIHCNSNQNSQSKAMGNMPNAYLRMEISKENKTLYSYYKDIKGEITSKNIEDGFNRMKKDLKIYEKL